MGQRLLLKVRRRLAHTRDDQYMMQCGETQQPHTDASAVGPATVRSKPEHPGGVNPKSDPRSAHIPSRSCRARPAARQGWGGVRTPSTRSATYSHVPSRLVADSSGTPKEARCVQAPRRCRTKSNRPLAYSSRRRQRISHTNESRSRISRPFKSALGARS